ncbi:MULTISPECIES: DUF4064 domain-containing protein [unclassified Staphylococcus]|uniref:DUF4064 domain-containing protein n=1 Tax=unclassified Staphylococcus TaxID=91994 RepID=UPI0021D0E6B7|nr:MULTISPECIES: DUF4064 domain-containing protein [unclassified Staphylococcus]UXR78971.1 DUF4064 domain-containing protein [Staphylococcus sp. IVB6227]UXR83131.1 DUF4064 domain-containing protein [Staphylococcus sp. IVB6214]
MSENYTYQSYEAPEQQQVQEKHPIPPNKPFKRTIEKSLTWIGLVLHLIWGLLIAFGTSMLPKIQSESPELRKALIEEGYDPELLNKIDPTSMIIIAIVMTVIPFILALIAVFLFKKSVLAGILLILAAVLGVVMSGSFIAALLWFVAAIMLFVRKPKDSKYVVSNDEHRTF